MHAIIGHHHQSLLITNIIGIYEAGYGLLQCYLYKNIYKAPETGACVRGEACGVGVRRGVARGVRSQVVGMATPRGAPPSFRSSMSEDLERGKPLELPWLSGRMHQLGQQLGVPTPAHTAVYRGLVLKASPPSPFAQAG